MVIAENCTFTDTKLFKRMNVIDIFKMEFLKLEFFDLSNSARIIIDYIIRLCKMRTPETIRNIMGSSCFRNLAKNLKCTKFKLNFKKHAACLSTFVSISLRLIITYAKFARDVTYKYSFFMVVQFY